MEQQDGLPAPQRYYAMVTIILGIGLSVLDGAVVNLALPGMVRDLNSTAPHAVWVVNAYQLATLALLLPLATVGDRIGYRRVYLAGAAVFTVASLACALAGSLPALAISRAVQGAGAAGIMAVNSALVRRTFPIAMLGRGIAVNSMAVATASVAGPTVAAAILSVASWPWLFAINLPLGIVVLWLGRRALPENTEHAAQATVSPLELLLNAGMFIPLFLGAEMLGAGHSGDSAQANTTVGGLALLATSIVIGIIYIRQQSRRPRPLLAIDLLRIPIFRLSMATSVSAFASQMLAFIALPFLFIDAWKLSPGQAGVLMTAWPIGVIVAAPVAGRLIGRYPGGLLGGVGLGALALGLALLAFTVGGGYSGHAAWQLVLCGLGFGLFQSPNNHTIITSAPVARSGAAGGMLSTARLTGQSLGAVILAAIFAISSAHEGSGPQVALGVAAAFAATAAFFSGLRLRA